jgi:hypothetical protein
VKEMKVFQVNYFAKGLQRVSIVVARNEEKGEQAIFKTFNGEDDYVLDRIFECELTLKRLSIRK